MKHETIVAQSQLKLLYNLPAVLLSGLLAYFDSHNLGINSALAIIASMVINIALLCCISNWLVISGSTNDQKKAMDIYDRALKLYTIVPWVIPAGFAIAYLLLAPSTVTLDTGYASITLLVVIALTLDKQKLFAQHK